MSRELSVVEKKLLSSKVPKALGQGRKSYETKIEANDLLQKAGYDLYFKVDIPIDHKDKKAKLNVPLAYTSVKNKAGIGARTSGSAGIGTGAGTSIAAGTSFGVGVGVGIDRNLAVKADFKSVKNQVCNMCNMCNMCNIFNFIIIFRRRTF